RIEHGAAERRLARAGLAGDHEQAFAPAEPVEELGVGPLMRRAQVEEPGVGRDRERLLGEPVENLVDRIAERVWRWGRLHRAIIEPKAQPDRRPGTARRLPPHTPGRCPWR